MREDWDETDDVIGSLSETDQGDVTGSLFEFQYMIGVGYALRLLEEAPEWSELFCEHHDDFLARRKDDRRLVAIQVKARDQSRAWSFGEKDFAKTMRRFMEFEKKHPRAFHSYVFATNRTVPKDIADLGKFGVSPGSLPQPLIRACQAEGEEDLRILSEVVRKLTVDDTLPSVRHAKAVLRVRVEQALGELESTRAWCIVDRLRSMVREASIRPPGEERLYLQYVASETSKPHLSPEVEKKRLTPAKVKAAIQGRIASTATHLPGRPASKLPVYDGLDFVGRANELALLDEAWANPHMSVVVFHGQGGQGKTALVHQWLQERWPRVQCDGDPDPFIWSFYNQGAGLYTGGHSLEFFREAEAALLPRESTEERPETAAERTELHHGVRLAEAIRDRRQLVILDGLEPLQEPAATSVERPGRLLDDGISGFLSTLATGSQGLCIVLTRLEVADLVGHSGRGAEQHPLDVLPKASAIQLLESAKVDGPREELATVAETFGYHAFSLVHVGRLLADRYHGDPRRIDQIPELTGDAGLGRHARRIMSSYTLWLESVAEENLDPLFLATLFDRTVTRGSLELLSDAIAEIRRTGQSLSFVGPDDPVWNEIVSHLCRLNLLSVDELGAIDMHPLVREYFRNAFRARAPHTWTFLQDELFRALQRVPLEHCPHTDADMEPLLRAIWHGTQAGQTPAAYDLFRARVMHGGEEGYLWKGLGRYLAELSVIGNFFEERWHLPSDTLKTSDRAYLVTEAALCLQAQGRVRDAEQAISQALRNLPEDSTWLRGRSLYNLGQMRTSLGDLDLAQLAAREAIAEVEEWTAGECKTRWLAGCRALLADVLLQRNIDDPTESLWQSLAPETVDYWEGSPLLLAVTTLRSCDFLTDRGRFEEALATALQRRAAHEAHQSGATGQLLSSGFYELAIGFSIRRALEVGDAAALRILDDPERTAAECLDRAVTLTFRSSRSDRIAQAYLERAAFRRMTGARDLALEDLNAAHRHATGGFATPREHLRLYLVDYHINYARLLGAGTEDAKEHVDRARVLIEATGYHRRLRELPPDS